MMPGECEKCGGRLRKLADRHGSYLQCYNCGSLRDEPSSGRMGAGEGLREHMITNYPDGGCEIWHSCLECPLPECRLDNPGMGQRFLTVRRESGRIQVILREKLKHAEAARRFGVSPSHVRYLMKCHEELGEAANGKTNQRDPEENDPEENDPEENGGKSNDV